MKKIGNGKLNKLQEFVGKHNINLDSSRFALSKNNEWIYLANTTDKETNNSEISMFVIIENIPIKAGFLTYSIGKGFWKSRQTNLFKIEVDEKFRGNGLATYALAFLTEISNNKRIDTMDGKFYPSNNAAQIVYDKNGFTVEKEYYDTRVVKTFYDDEIENIEENTSNFNGVKVYSNHRNLYTRKHRTPENVGEKTAK